MAIFCTQMVDFCRPGHICDVQSRVLAIVLKYIKFYSYNLC